MTEIQADIAKVAYDTALSVRQEIATSGIELILHNPKVDAIIARAILAERDRCANAVSDVSLKWVEDGNLDLQKALGEVIDTIIRGDA
ncbi:hypothetical protein GOL95_10105 [Sinorhizobium medicae]|nr:hypothetical protein [Sinorhizobium medicae]